MMGRGSLGTPMQKLSLDILIINILADPMQ